MLYGIYGIKDRRIGAFLSIWISNNDQTAIRMVKAANLEERPNEANSFPEDRELWRIGTFHDLDGTLVSDMKHLIDLPQKKEEEQYGRDYKQTTILQPNEQA